MQLKFQKYANKYALIKFFIQLLNWITSRINIKIHVCLVSVIYCARI